MMQPVGVIQNLTQKKTRLLTGADKITFQPTEMKGQKIELRTIVQNLSDTKLSQVTLQVWVNHADGTIATADGQPVAASETFKIPLWTEKGNFRPKGTLEYHGSDFNSGLKNCSLLYTIRPMQICEPVTRSDMQ